MLSSVEGQLVADDQFLKDVDLHFPEGAKSKSSAEIEKGLRLAIAWWLRSKSSRAGGHPGPRRGGQAREWTDDMGEIIVGTAEAAAACRVMVLAGLDWLDTKPVDTAGELAFREYENVQGVIEAKNDSAKALSKHMTDAAKAYGEFHGSGGATGAMLQAAVHHVMYAHAAGWEGYQTLMRGRPEAKADTGGRN
jgi:hypothetical protein